MSDKPSIVEALSKVMADVQAVGKKSRNTEQGYNFRGVDAVVNAVGPELRKHGVIVLPMLEHAAYRDVTTSRGKPSRECTVQVRYRFYGPAGDFIEAVVPGESMDFGDKGAAKAMSVAYRIALLQALCIPTDEPDPDAQAYERGRQGEWEQAARPPTPDQVEWFNTLVKAVQQAKDSDDMRAVWLGPVKSAHDNRRITDGQLSKLRAMRDIRLDGWRAEPVGDGGEPNAG